MKAISLFAGGGIGDLGLRQAGFCVIVANELIKDRAEVFKYNHPDTYVVVGDIREKIPDILDATHKILNGNVLDIVFATPPCQGMSKNGRGKLLNLVRKGHRDAVDPRNLLIMPTIEVFLKSGAHTLMLENVPEMETTLIPDPLVEAGSISIVDYIKRSLGSNFIAYIKTVEFANYGVPQCRQRLISIFTKNDDLKLFLKRHGSLLPQETHSKDGSWGKKWITVRDTIYDLPALDAGSPETARDRQIPYHRVPLLDIDKYYWVSNTPEERSAFDNQCVNPECGFQNNPTHSAKKDKRGINKACSETPIFCVKCGALLPRPWVKDTNGYRLMKGYTSAYKRMSWDLPASTLTRNLSYACSDNKIHPSQNRVLSLYEAMKLHTVSNYDFHWKRADGKNVSDKLIRELIGESIPPAALEEIFRFLADLLKGKVKKYALTNQIKQLELCLDLN